MPTHTHVYIICIYSYDFFVMLSSPPPIGNGPIVSRHQLMSPRVLHLLDFFVVEDWIMTIITLAPGRPPSSCHFIWFSIPQAFNDGNQVLRTTTVSFGIRTRNRPPLLAIGVILIYITGARGFYL